MNISFPLRCFLTLILLWSAGAFSQRHLGARPTDSGGPLLPEQAGYNVTFYDLKIAVFPDSKTISGEVTVHANIVHPLEWFVLDLDSFLTVQQVRLQEGKHALPLKFRHENGQIWAHLKRSRQPGERVAITVQYGGAPRVAPRPPWVGGFSWSQTADGQPWIATSNQSDGADLWWPCKDHPSDEPDSLALHITVPKSLTVASNGRLRRISTGPDDTATYHWFVSTPINNYGVALNIAPYKTITGGYQSVSGMEIPVTYWVLPENYDKGKILFKQILEHLAFYEKLLGPYPFRADKYGVAETPFLGMEHQTIIAYGANYSNAPHGYDILHHHELGHEWWGNLVTALDWRDFWLHEGLCSYMHPLYLEHLRGREAYLQALAGSRLRMRNERAVAPRHSETTVERYFVPPDYLESDGDVFNKGVWVLHTLRYLIGEEHFFTLLRRMAYPDPALEQVTDGRQCRFATTDDFLALAEAISGQQLDWFFEVYLRQPELPRLNAKREGKQLHLAWETPGELPFSLPVEVKISDNVRRIDMPGGKGTVEIGDAGEFTIDPNKWLLMEE